MNTITVKNLSTFTDQDVLVGVAKLMAGDKYSATHDRSGREVVKIIKRGNTYTVTDKG